MNGLWELTIFIEISKFATTKKKEKEAIGLNKTRLCNFFSLLGAETEANNLKKIYFFIYRKFCSPSEQGLH